jgi:hypothetical protein
MRVLVYHRSGALTGTKTHEVDRHCHRGQITFEAEVDPTALTIRHCTDCQTLTDSAFRINIPAPAEHFVLLSGTPKSYVKTAAELCPARRYDHAACGVLTAAADLAAFCAGLGGRDRRRAGD